MFNTPVTHRNRKRTLESKNLTEPSKPIQFLVKTISSTSEIYFPGSSNLRRSVFGPKKDLKKSRSFKSLVPQQTDRIISSSLEKQIEELGVEDWNFSSANNPKLKKRIKIAIDVLEFVREKNTSFKKMGQYVVDLFKLISFANFHDLHFAKKPTQYYSEEMKRVLASPSNSLFVYDLIASLMSELVVISKEVDKANKQHEKELMKKDLIIARLMDNTEVTSLKENILNLKGVISNKESELYDLNAYVKPLLI